MTSKPPTPRQRARATTIDEIKDAALAQMASYGPSQLSLRAIARQRGMASSGIYRYFTSRDELLTALIIDTYEELAQAIAGAAGRETSPVAAWEVGCQALRHFAREQPHRFLLVYGSPLSDYRAPSQTIEPAAGVIQALTAPLAHAGIHDDAETTSGIEPDLLDQVEQLSAALQKTLPAWQALAAMHAVSQLLGLLMLELGGHLVGTFDPADALYADAVQRAGDQLGLCRRDLRGRA